MTAHASADSDVAHEPPSPRRLAVESARAERCIRIRADLLGLQEAAAARASRVLEIGCGHGHFLEAYAAAHPDHFCLGIDYCAERARRAQRKQQRNAHGNLHFMRAEVWEFLEALPSAFLFDDVFVLFPDPWPKRRHRKYRLISERFLARLGSSTRPGARLCFRTDAAFYFAEAQDLIAAHPAWTIDRSAAWPFEQPTVFQAKAPSYQSLVALNERPAR